MGDGDNISQAYEKLMAIVRVCDKFLEDNKESDVSNLRAIRFAVEGISCETNNLGEMFYATDLREAFKKVKKINGRIINNILVLTEYMPQVPKKYRNQSFVNSILTLYGEFVTLMTVDYFEYECENDKKNNSAPLTLLQLIFRKMVV